MIRYRICMIEFSFKWLHLHTYFTRIKRKRSDLKGPYDDTEKGEPGKGQGSKLAIRKHHPVSGRRSLGDFAMHRDNAKRAPALFFFFFSR